MKPAVLLELHYFPSLDYFATLLRHESLVLEAQESFQKQTYRNRCYTLQTNKKMLLSVPVRSGAQRMKITEVEIDHHSNWAALHWRSIQSTYGKTPFFEFYAEDFRRVLEAPPQTLFALNEKILTICLEHLGVHLAIEKTSAYHKIYPNLEDKRDHVHPKKPDRFTYPRYWQPFGSEFVPNLSILDLLFCAGTEARKVLRAATPNK